MANEPMTRKPLEDPSPPADRQRPPSRVRSFLGRRLSRDEYLGLHFTLGMILSLAMLGLFVTIARNAIGETQLTQFDTAIGLGLEENRLAYAPLGNLFGVITQMGNKITLGM